MFSSIVNHSKLLIPHIQRRLGTLIKLNWKYKLCIALSVCIIIVTYLHANKKGAAFEKKLPHIGPTSKLRGEYGEISEKEIIILQCTSFWGSVYPAIHLNSDQCSILKTGTTQQPPISSLFDVPCRITYDQKYLNESQAVVFQASDINSSLRPSSKLPKKLLALNQIWIWFETESPSHVKINLTESQYQNIFNWTMSYRRDSDVYYPYGYIFPSNVSTSLPVLGDYRKSLQTKSRLAAWIVSTCATPSRREHFVKELQQYIPVDVFGKCGQTLCPLNQDAGYFTCYSHIQSKYKFYLALENSLCNSAQCVGGWLCTYKVRPAKKGILEYALKRKLKH